MLGLFAPSLKAPDPRAWPQRQIAYLAPAAIVNATSFSGRGEAGTSPLDAGGVPVFQVALSTSTRTAWAEAPRGLSPADRAMHVVLPEVDGRLFAGVASFKQSAARDPHLQFSRFVHRPDADRINAIADRVTAWHRLAATPAGERRVALVLSTYPGRDWNMAHAVGLDALASGETILSDLGGAGYANGPGAPLAKTLPEARIHWSMADYKAALATLPQALQDDLHTTWGALEHDSDATPDESRCNPSAARPTSAMPSTTMSPACRVTGMWPFTCGSGPRLTRWSMLAHMAHWNGCPVNPWHCRRRAGPRRSWAIYR